MCLSEGAIIAVLKKQKTIKKQQELGDYSQQIMKIKPFHMTYFKIVLSASSSETDFHTNTID